MPKIRTTHRRRVMGISTTQAALLFLGPSTGRSSASAGPSVPMDPPPPYTPYAGPPPPAYPDPHADAAYERPMVQSLFEYERDTNWEWELNAAVARDRARASTPSAWFSFCDKKSDA